MCVELYKKFDIMDIKKRFHRKQRMDGDGGLIPGFELVMLISSIAISIIIHRKKPAINNQPLK